MGSKITAVMAAGLMMFAVANEPRILGNIFINGVDVGGLSREAALERLHTEIPIGDEKICVKVDEMEFKYIFKDFGAGYDFEEALTQAQDYSRSEGFLKSLARKFSLSIKKHNIEADYAYDEEKAAQIAAKIADDAAVAAEEPGYQIQNGQFVIKQGKTGRKVDPAPLTKDIVDLLSGKSGGVINARAVKIEPERTAAQFEAATDLIGSFTTPFDPSNADRAANLAVASRYLNNQVILPGQVFSTSRALRPRTVENGYVKAGQIRNGEPDAGIGGGICQISSTLYMAALYAELPIHERRNHSLLVAYMAPATDATIAEGHIDLKFENNTDHPMLIESILTNRQHTINIYGHETRPPQRQINFETVLVEQRPQDDKVIEDPLLPPGMRRIIFDGMPGGRYELYKVITENGRAQRVKINSSNYQPIQRVVRVGAMGY